MLLLLVCAHQWYISTGKSLTLATEKRQTLAAIYASNASTFTTFGSDCQLLVYDSSTGKCQITLEARLIKQIWILFYFPFLYHYV